MSLQKVMNVDPDNTTPSPGAMSDVREPPREGESYGDGREGGRAARGGRAGG